MPTASVSGQSGATGNITVTAKNPGPRWLKYVQPDAGTAGVTVVGNTITVTPGSGANTADAVKAQIEANAAANALISVVSGGAGEPGITTGVDLVGAGAMEPFAIALEAIDNSAVAAVARIRAQLL